VIKLKEVKILSPTGHLGFTPIEEESFWKGVNRKPDFICADSGSCDIGPYPLGADVAASPEEWQKHDLELMLLASRELDVPMIIGSASDTGTNRGVNQFARIIKDLAKKHELKPFKMATIYADVQKETLLKRLEKGDVIEGLHGRPPLNKEILSRTDHIVAVMGVEPYIKALEEGADVIIAGRSSDVAVFAAPALWSGIPENIAFYAGKVLECASFVAEPFAGKESVLGILREDEVIIEPMSNYQRATPESVASHAMYERIDPFIEWLPGGYIDMRGCVYEAIDEKRTRVRGSKFYRTPEYKIKLEGSGKVGERCFMIVGIRDPYLIANLDKVIEWSRKKVKEKFGESGYDLYYHVYGINGVMGELEPIQNPTPHEVGIIVEGIAPNLEMAKELTYLAGRNFLYARLIGVKGTAGAAAFISDEVLVAHPAYEWTINHLVKVNDPLELFDIRFETVGGI